MTANLNDFIIACQWHNVLENMKRWETSRGTKNIDGCWISKARQAFFRLKFLRVLRRFFYFKKNTLNGDVSRQVLRRTCSRLAHTMSACVRFGIFPIFFLFPVQSETSERERSKKLMNFFFLFYSAMSILDVFFSEVHKKIFLSTFQTLNCLFFVLDRKKKYKIL